MTISQRIKFYRTEANLSQADLAAACGVSPPNVSYWESGKSEPRLKHLYSIAAACGIESHLLLEDSKDVPAGEVA